MNGGGLGGGVIFVVAALLWAAVLVPAWIRRREFRAAERNAIRLQRTLRVLAETTEVPQEVHLEATAREALAHEKLLRSAQKRQEAEREADLAEARAEQVRAEIRAQQMKRKQVAARRSARLRRPVMRRVRALAALFALAGIVGLVLGAGFAIAGRGASILAWSALSLSVGLGTLVLVAPGRARMREVPAERVEEPMVVPAAEAVVGEPESVGETEESAEAHAAAQRAAAERIERAQAMARARAARPKPVVRENQPDSMLLREAREQVSRARSGTAGSGASPVTEGAELRPAASTATAPAAKPATPARSQSASAKPAPRENAEQRAARERLRRMGVVGDTGEGMPDLSAALRRHRRVG